MILRVLSLLFSLIYFPSSARQFTGFWHGASDSLKNIPFSLRALRMSIEQHDSTFNGEFTEFINGKGNMYARWKMSNGVIKNDSASFDLLELIDTNFPSGMPLLKGRHFIFRHPPKRYLKSGIVSFPTNRKTIITATISTKRISTKSPAKYEGMPVLDLPDLPFLILGILATVSITLNWRHFDLPARVICIYPLLAYGFAFEPDNPNFGDDPDYPVAYQLFYGLIDWIFYTILALYFFIILKRKSIRIRIIISIPLFFLFGMVGFSSKIEPDLTFVSLDNIVESFFIIYMSFIYLWRILVQNQIRRPERDRNFWFVSALLLYFVAVFFITALIKLFSVWNEPLFSDWNYIRCVSRSFLFCMIIVILYMKFPKTGYG